MLDMATIGTIGNVLGAAMQATRKPVQISIPHNGWSETVAVQELANRGHGAPVNGDCVLMLSAAYSLEPRYFQDGAWLTTDQYLAYPTTGTCPHCSGTGKRQIPGLFFLGVCAECKGTGKREVVEVVAEPSRPGLGDEIKPDLMTKKLRSW